MVEMLIKALMPVDFLCRILFFEKFLKNKKKYEKNKKTRIEKKRKQNLSLRNALLLKD